MTDVHQSQEILSIVISQALGGGKTEPAPDPTTAPRNADELEARMARFI